MQWNAMHSGHFGHFWRAKMECNAVEWNGMDAFWVICLSFCTLLVILGNVFVKKRTIEMSG